MTEQLKRFTAVLAFLF